MVAWLDWGNTLREGLMLVDWVRYLVPHGRMKEFTIATTHQLFESLVARVLILNGGDRGIVPARIGGITRGHLIGLSSRTGINSVRPPSRGRG